MTSSITSSSRRATPAASRATSFTTSCTLASTTARRHSPSQLRFTAQYGKRFGWLQLRGGLKESEFGIGADVLLNQGALRLSFDAYTDSFFNVPDIKLTAAYEVLHSVFFVGGVTDALTRPGELNIETGNSPQPTVLQRRALRARLLPRRDAAVHRR